MMKNTSSHERYRKELKPCPLCGNRVEIEIFIAEAWIRCERCKLSLRADYTRQAIDKWNARALVRFWTELDGEWGEESVYMWICSECGGKVPEKANYCPECGREVDQ